MPYSSPSKVSRIAACDPTELAGTLNPAARRRRTLPPPPLSLASTMGDANDPFMRNKDAAVQARTKAQNRANVLQLKMMGQSHPTGLTPNLLKLFEPRPPLEHKPPPEKRPCPAYTGMAEFVSRFAEPGEPEYSPPVKEGETKAQKKERIHKLQLEKGAIKAAEDLEKYDPTKDPNISGDPYKTLFVAKLNYETTENRLKREFEAYGPIKRVRLITDKETNKPRGYAFIEFVHTRDMKTAYKQADGRKVDNKRVLVDVERGRTVPNWRPRRLGGGLGSTRVGGEELNQKHSGREQKQIASGAPPRSEEPKARDDRRHERPRDRSRERGRESRDAVREREKSREREREKPREREREKSRELSHDRRDRDPREDRHRHHRDHDRHRDGERERDRGHDRGRVHSRDRGRDRGHERDNDYPRERKRERERDHDSASHEKDRGYSDGREIDYDPLEPFHHRERSTRQKLNDDPIKHGLDHNYDRHKKPQYEDPYDHFHPQGLDESVRNQESLKQREPEYHDHDSYGKSYHDGFQSKFDHTDPEPREEGEAIDEDYDNVYRQSERSVSREYKG